MVKRRIDPDDVAKVLGASEFDMLDGLTWQCRTLIRNVIATGMKQGMTNEEIDKAIEYTVGVGENDNVARYVKDYKKRVKEALENGS